MTEFRGAWTEAEVEDFLEETTVPIRIATNRPDGSLWLVALWYRYRNGVLECATGANATLVRFLRQDPEVAFDISTNDVPYRGIRGNGTVTMTTDSDKAVLRALIERYLDGTSSPLARWLLGDDREEVRIEIEPRTIYSWDYSSRMGGNSTEPTA
ncbi:pyridoxamine 5'-phosphate oxidase family protein [Natrinema halophilum]|uniref:Pyridoxamine 5'-phosphate oxidase family protein n=1 Tax=Natrinema halophilum TaxID=1699371 RepID=A0A7D5KJC8_9EURY|nr:pyridoxamine 5'-phosphate oxidase family protein [Natrinema halophilum]QLG49339.1 pyridoxamine 5'-phosphate oxidase family protein [Natrinema halophilum]